MYQKRLEQTFIVQDITEDEKKKALLLTSVGGSICNLLWDLFSPEEPTDPQVSYADICNKLSSHFIPAKIEIAERFRFYQRKQLQEESVANYVAVLRNLSKDCAFGDFLQQALRDAFVIGLHDRRIQTALLSEANLTLDAAVKKAVSLEAAAQQTKELRQGDSSNINAIRDRKPGCYRCGETHRADTCKYKDLECYNCKKKGHCAAKCHAKKDQQASGEDRPKGRPRQKKRGVNYQGEKKEEDEYNSDLELFHLPESGRVPARPSRPIKTEFIVDGSRLSMELDTGAGYSVISEAEWRRKGSPKLKPTTLQLVTYTGEPVNIMGEFDALVEWKTQKKLLPLLVVGGSGPALCGRNWLRAIRLDWEHLLHLPNADHTSKLAPFKDVFSKELGTIKVPPVHLDLKPDAVPKFFRPRPIPYALKNKVQEEIRKLVSSGILYPVESSNWGAPIVVVPKPNGNLRICGDYKVTVNPALVVDQYPLPLPEDIFATLEGGVLFSKLDLSQAYLQLELDEFSKELSTVNTPFGLYRYHRLPFGIASAPGKFQRVMDDLFRDLPWVKCYLDDILIAGRTNDEHWTRVTEVLRRLQTAGVRLQLEKCVFAVSELPYLGFIISKDGLKTSPEKVRAVLETKRPENLQSLRAFLGLVNYYGKFIPRLASVAAPLYQLLKKEVSWRWTSSQEEAWKLMKQLLTSAEVLCSYNPESPLILACDASPFGVAAVLAHRFPDGSERPIAYSSKSLSSAEKNYSQLDKEALAIVFGVKRFHSFLYGRSFHLITDHKPLLALLGPKTGIPPLAAARMQRWALILSAYVYKLEFRRTEEHGNADALSRFPLAGQAHSEKGFPPSSLFHVEFFEGGVTFADIQKAMATDTILSEAVERLKNGWRRADASSDLSSIYLKRNDLTLVEGVILWGRRVVVPEKLRSKVLDILHETHAGTVRMKALARSYVWWPGLDHQLEELTRNCPVCRENCKEPAKTKDGVWPTPPTPWHRLHIDYAGPIHGYYLLVIVDSTSRWPEIYMTKSTTSQATIALLQPLFARFGLPVEIVSDNGPQFDSEEFRNFTSRNGILHRMGAPYHPQSNGLAERMVQSVKSALLKMERHPGDFQTKLLRFLIHYRNTPHYASGASPASIMFGRSIRTRLDLLHPTPKVEREDFVNEKFHSGQKVFARDYRAGKPKWQPGVVQKRVGTYLYLVRCENAIVKRHVDQLQRGSGHSLPPTPVSDAEKDSIPVIEIETPPSVRTEPASPTLPPVVPAVPAVPPPPRDSTEGEDIQTTADPVPPAAVPLSVKRTRNPPSYLSDYIVGSLVYV